MGDELRTKNQHFVPQFYLRRFSSNQRSVRAFCIPQDRLIGTASIRHQCSKPYLYGRDGKLESVLGSIEGTAAGVLKALDRPPNTATISESDFETFLAFCVIQGHRTPANIRDAEEVDEQMREAMQRTRPLAAEDFADDDLPRGLTFENRLALIFTIYPMIMDMMFEVMLAAKGTEFLTSDLPTVQINPAAMRGIVKDSSALGSAGLALLYPISPHKILVFYDRGLYETRNRPGRQVRLTDRETLVVNALQVQNCDQMLYTGSLSEGYLRNLIEKATNGRRRNSEVRAYIPFGAGDSETYVEIAPDERVPAEKMLLTHSSIYPQPIEPLSFLRIRSRPRFVETNTGAGDYRQHGHIELLDMYRQDVRRGKAKLFRFTAYMRYLQNASELGAITSFPDGRL